MYMIDLAYDTGTGGLGIDNRIDNDLDTAMTAIGFRCDGSGSGFGMRDRQYTGEAQPPLAVLNSIKAAAGTRLLYCHCRLLAADYEEIGTVWGYAPGFGGWRPGR